MPSNWYFEFFYFDYDEATCAAFAKSPVSALAREQHPVFVELCDVVEDLCDNDPHREDALPSRDEVETPVGPPLENPTLVRLNAQPPAWSVPEQLNLFTLEEFGEFYVGPQAPRVIETLIGALLLDFHDAREGSLACTEFNRAVAEGWDPVVLRDRALEMCRFFAYAARKAGIAIIDYFKTYALESALASMAD